MNGRTDIAGILGSLFFASAGAYVFVASLGMSPMAAMFPRTVGAALALLALVQIVTALAPRLRNRERMVPRQDAAGEGSGAAVEADADGQAESRGRRLVLLATMVAWALLFPVVGIFVTSLAACIVLMFTGLFGRISPRRLALYLAVVLAMVIFFHLLMGTVLNIPLPRGLLF
ncbi:tripartite tricarboxylate transporter TctB family protein [Nitratireductor sp. ZSWI3]|uniref:tripartite tricarboxylate transporter TctB family protein n=1 Tax=Nitratireductor sp. ZSWI3 TaxID=2966359 RepID=UPI0021503225|nr:tripartite tricarboxylate transporter TctB family protein [Nitratireductor sp. ZSWI3]MCR4265462.1 tripartite tricarboxylate transporter TctB family protein [Nitratireductor sp. ZSWI3]